MRITLLIVALFWALPALTQTLQVMGSDEGFLPFYYGDNLDKGILVEVINNFGLEAGIAVAFHPMPRNRQVWALEEGRANAVFATPRWMPLPDQMHAVGPVLTWRDRVFAQPGRSRAPSMTFRAASACADGLFTAINSSGGSVPT